MKNNCTLGPICWGGCPAALGRGGHGGSSREWWAGMICSFSVEFGCCSACEGAPACRMCQICRGRAETGFCGLKWRAPVACPFCAGAGCGAVLARREGCWPDGLTRSWVLAGDVAGESRTLTVVGVVDCGAHGHRFLAGGIDVATLTFLPILLQGKP